MRFMYRIIVVLVFLLLLASCTADSPASETVLPTLQPTADMPTPTLASSVSAADEAAEVPTEAASVVDSFVTEEVATPVPPVVSTVEPEIVPTESVDAPVVTPTSVPLQLHQQISSEDLLTWIIDQRQSGQSLEQVATELKAVELLFDADSNHLYANGAKAYGEVDSLGNGVPFWAISLNRRNSQDDFLIELWLIGADRLELAFSEGHGEAPPLLLSQVDFNGDLVADYLFQQMNCGAHTCFGTYRAMSHSGGELSDVFDVNSELARKISAARPQVGLNPERPNFVNMSLPTIVVEDATGDGVADISMRGGMISSAGAGIHQGFNQLWSWQESNLVLVDFYWDYTGYRHHELYDGNYAFALGEREIAMTHYMRVMFEDSLADNYVAADDVAGVRELARQIAGFRLLMMAGGWENSWLEYLQESYPDEPITLAADLYLESRNSGLTDEESCPLVAEFLLQQEDPFGQYGGWLGYGNPDIDAQNLCQPAPNQDQEAQQPILWETAPPTGNELVDQVVAAVLSGDGLVLGALAQPIERPCTFEDGPGVLRCLEDEEEGQLISTLLMAQCEGYFRPRFGGFAHRSH